MGTTGSGASSAGGSGIHNEDSFVVEEGLGLYLVCDGASETPAGEVASRVAASSLEEFVDRAGDDLDLDRGIIARAVVERAMRYALEAVLTEERSDPDLAGLSTTVTMLLAHGTTGVVGHRGDSRAYLIRRGRSHQLTTDLELTQAAAAAGQADPGYEVFTLDLESGDTILLCTDGAEDVIDGDLVRAASGLSPRLLASRIVSAARRRNPDADATAVVVRIAPKADRAWVELSTPPRGTRFGHTIPLA